jgi:N-acetylglucosamine kinase-like BadF-type ATPase
MQAAMGAIHEAAHAALRQARLRPDEVQLVFGGLTGADWPDEYLLLEENLQALGLGAQTCVVNDCMVALRGGTRAPYGAIVIAGSGGNCAVRSPDLQEFIYHFYQEFDLQGGQALGRKLLTAVYRSATGREPATCLTGRILEHFDMDTVDQLLRADVEGRIPLETVRAIAPLLLQAACEGDPVARKIAQTFGAGLAELVTAGLQRFHMTGLEVEVVLSGSIFKGHGRFLEEIMAGEIHKTAPRVKLVNARYEPVVGALLCGLETLGIEVDERVRQSIDRTSAEFQLIRINSAKTSEVSETSKVCIEPGGARIPKHSHLA